MNTKELLAWNEILLQVKNLQELNKKRDELFTKLLAVITGKIMKVLEENK